MRTLVFLSLLLPFVLNAPKAVGQAAPFTIPASEVVSITDSATGRRYELYIKLPPGYSGGRHYPAVYITDALANFQIISGSSFYPMGNHKMEAAILVGISWELGSRPILSRQWAFTPTLESDWESPTGGAESHLAFIRNDVIPYIEGRYNTDPQRRTYFGHSLGGLFGAYILLTSPGTFKNYILASPSFWYDDRVINSFESRYAAGEARLDANVFIAIGELETPELKGGRNDMVKQAIEFHDRLRDRHYSGLNLKMMVIADADHEMSLPTAAIHGLYWLFERSN